MCGFIGRINKQSDKQQIRAALAFLQRRGPDSHAVWSSTDKRIDLLHTRLAIVDTDDRAHQPFTDEASRVTVAFNGEIYNYRELRSEISNYRFRSESDTEIIIALYVAGGIDGLKRLRGMFSLVIVDESTQRVYLARDPIGKKPLFFSRWSCGTYFGSSVLALVAASKEAAEIESEQVQSFWNDAHVAPNRSLISGCLPVAPGEVLELSWTGEVLNVYSCTPDFDLESIGDLPDVGERVRELIQQSVRRRLSNNPTPLSLLSGGVDSTIIASSMKKIAGGSAITLGSVLRGTNDEKYARFAAKRLELPLRTVRARSTNLADDVSWTMDLQDEALGMISFFPLAMMIRAAKDHGRILLTGDGGDEVFLGYGTPEDWLGSHHPNGNHSPIPTPAWMSEWGKRMVTTSLLGHMFTKLDRASAEQGVETRCPLLDVDLVLFVRSLKPEVLFGNGRAKSLLKDQLQSWPDGFVNRPKVGFAYNLRWAWAASRFAGLREMVTREAVDTFESQLPAELRAAPMEWTMLAIFRNFPAVWKLLAWSKFLERLNVARGKATTPRHL